MIIWALFDSGNGCYKQVVEKHFPDVEIYSVGLDIENKNDHFIHLNLADFSEFFGGKGVFGTLDKLPRPDVILASPPCESWSQMLNIKNGTFAWQMEQEVTCLLDNHTVPTPFTIQTRENFYKAKKKLNAHQGFKENGQFEKQVKSRINGELTVLKTLEIIKKYEPRIWIIENPAYGRLWQYLRESYSFRGIENLVCYNDYDTSFSQKPTIFMSNIYLDLVATRQKSAVIIRGGKCKTEKRKCIRGYNERSNIPLPLVRDIIKVCKSELEKSKESEHK